MTGIKLWWGGQSKTAKSLYIFGTLALIGTAIYLANRKKDGSKKLDDKKSSDIPSDTNTDTVKADVVQVPVDKATLPNGGVGCGDIKTNFDRDFDYVKCDNVWYTKSKSNPASAYAKGLYKDWKSLASNSVATERLNRRYQKG